jgi:Protein of unknown function (DUF3095)
MTNDHRDFYASLPILDNFADAVRSEAYRGLPDDWIVCVSDVVGSTKAVATGRYKAVNMVSAGAIAAVANALERRPFPFVFAGDGARFAVSGRDAQAASEALSAMAAFSRHEFELDLRIAMISAREIRVLGREVKIARYAASEHCDYAMFAGGGLAWFGDQAKRGAYSLPPAETSSRPDLSGLSCRWGVAPAKHGIVLSMVVAPRGDDPRFSFLLEEVVEMALDAAQEGRPITVEGLGVASLGKAIPLEAAALATSGVSLVKAHLTAAANCLVGATFHTLKLKAGGFDAALYVADVAANADFRKFDDGLRMTLDCTPAFADALEARLIAADDIVNWGLYRQKSAQLTSFAPSMTERGHVHFVDGAEGGYTMAATTMKARRLLKASQAA